MSSVIQVPIKAVVSKNIDIDVCKVTIQSGKPLSTSILQKYISSGMVTFKQAAEELHIDTFLNSLTTSSKNIFPFSIYVGTFSEPLYENRYHSQPHASSFLLAINKAYVESGFEAHMLGVILWAAFLKQLRKKTDHLRGTFYETDSIGRRGNRSYDFAATSFTTLYVSMFSKIHEHHGIIVPKQVHAFDDLSYAEKVHLLDIYESISNILKSTIHKADIDDIIQNTHKQLAEIGLLADSYLTPYGTADRRLPHIHVSTPDLGMANFFKRS